MKNIIEKLAKFPGISDWRVINTRTTSYQLYVIGDLVDNLRKVVTNKYTITVYCDHDGMRGSTDMTLFEHDISKLDLRLEEAVYICNRVGNPQFSLQSPSYYPFVETFDPTLLGDIQQLLFVKLADQLIDLVDREPGVRLSSSEFFADLQDISIKNSRGVDMAYRKTHIFFDGVLFAGSADSEVEMHFEPRARRLQDLPIETIVHKNAQFARDSVDADLPVSGRYPVVLSGNALSGVFSPLIHHTSAAAKFRNTSRLRENEFIATGGTSSGEPLNLISNGFIPFGLRTFPADSDGVPTSRFELIRDGVFVKPWSTRQFADYLKVQPTGAVTNLEIPIGPSALESLLKEKGRVLHVVSFSAMMPDLVSGNFAAEIKLGYEYSAGGIRAVKGGSVSGNLITGFQNACYSTEAALGNYALSLESFGSYSGPEAIRFENFQISGD